MNLLTIHVFSTIGLLFKQVLTIHVLGLRAYTCTVISAFQNLEHALRKQEKRQQNEMFGTLLALFY